MKYLFLLLLLPLLSPAQTIHFKKKEIIYKGIESASGLSATEVAGRLPNAVAMAADKSDARMEILSTGNPLTWKGTIKLNMPYHIVRTLHFTLQLTPKEGGYDYRIDSVSVIDRRRGDSVEVSSAEELLEGIEDTGPEAIEAERLLNEIDMRFQKLLVLLERHLTPSPSPAKL